MSPSQIGYCPWCQAELSVEEIELHTLNIVWTKCKTYRCKGGRDNVKTSQEGFVLEPLIVRDRYVFSRWCND